MTQFNESPMTSSAFIKNVHGVRYQVRDVARAVAFYSLQFGFKLEYQHLPQFAAVSLNGTVLLLSGPGSSGSRPLAGAQPQEPGGWNRIVLHTVDLSACITALKRASVRIRNDVVSGPAGSQVQIEDPDGNPVELFDPAP